MRTSFFAFFLLIILQHAAYTLNSNQFVNFRATERHDSYLSFENSISFPLSLKWAKSDISCTFSDPFMEIVFDGSSIYCIANENDGPLSRNINSSIVSISIKDGSIDWRTYLYNTTIPGEVNTSFTGLVYVYPNYISVLDNNFGYLYLLNAATGEIVQNVSIPESCPINMQNGYYCIQSGITSSSAFNSSVVFYTTSIPDNNPIGTLFNLDINGKIMITKADGYIFSVAQMPTICENDVVITTNLYDKIDAFDMRNNLEHLWSFNISKSDEYGTVSDIPALCIPTNDNYFNILVTSLEVNVVQEKWHLIDGRSGKLLNEVTWQSEYGGLPAVHVDKMLLIRNLRHNLIVYNLSSSVYATNWTEVWSVKHSSDYFDIVIINDYILLSNATAFDVYSINNGSFIWSYTYPIDNGPFYNSKIIAGLSSDDKPMIIVLALHQNTQPIQSTIFVLT